ncbi:hypothetical protein JOM56_003408 [Amanita muscaria]
MLTHRGFSAWIVVDGKEVPEHLVAVDIDANRVSCWIPGEEGQSFSVYWKDHGGRIDTCAFITLDGFVVPGRFLFGEGVACREGVRTSRTTERPFIFQKVHDEATSTMQAMAKDAGMIALRIKRITRVASKPANELQSLPSAVLGKRKAGDLFVGFGEEAPAFEQYSSTWSVKPYGQNGPSCKEPKTYVSFVFRYRTREFLEAQGIIPESAVRPPQRPLVRRIVSMPSWMPSAMAPTPPDSPETGLPNKKKKMTSMAEQLRDGPRQPQGDSIDARRTVSWKIVTNKAAGP